MFNAICRHEFLSLCLYTKGFCFICVEGARLKAFAFIKLLFLMFFIYVPGINIRQDDWCYSQDAWFPESAIFCPRWRECYCVALQYWFCINILAYLFLIWLLLFLGMTSDWVVIADTSSILNLWNVDLADYCQTVQRENSIISGHSSRQAEAHILWQSSTGWQEISRIQ